MQRELRITGEGKLALNPDIALLKLPVEQMGESYNEAVQNLNATVSWLQDLSQHFGIDQKKLKTKDFRVREEWGPANKKGERDFYGFLASHYLELELPLDNTLIHNFLSALTQSEAGIDFSLRFDVSDKDQYKDKLIQNAVADALASAKVIAEATEVSLKEIIHINYAFSEVHFHNDNFMYESSMHLDAMSMPDFSPDTIHAEKNITVVWRIE